MKRVRTLSKPNALFLREVAIVEISEFEGWLQKGLGRVVLFLQKNDAKPYRDSILHACRHNLAHDRQCEHLRGQYLYDIIQATGEPRFYRKQILASLVAPLEEECQSQLFEIAELMAKAGDNQARSVMAMCFARNAEEQDWTGAEEIVRLDGMQGFRFVAEQITLLDMVEDGWQLTSCVGLLEERDGKEATQQAFAKYGAEDPFLARLYEAVCRTRARSEAKRKQYNRDRKAGKPASHEIYLPYTELKMEIVEKGLKARRSFLWRWSRNCQDAEEIEQAAQDLLAEQNEERLPVYLDLFWDKPFPLDCERLISLADHMNDIIS